VERIASRRAGETKLADTSALNEHGDVRGCVVVVVAVGEDGCTSVAAGQLWGAICWRSVGRTGSVRPDSSNLHFVASCCMGRSAICYGCCLVGQYKKRRYNRPETESTAMVVG